ncbi:protein SCAI isoform X2 [Zonotrichia albicollis]
MTVNTLAMDLRTTRILDSLEAAPPVTLATRSCDSSTLRSSSCFSSSSFFFPRRSRALILACGRRTSRQCPRPTPGPASRPPSAPATRMCGPRARWDVGGRPGFPGPVGRGGCPGAVPAGCHGCPVAVPAGCPWMPGGLSRGMPVDPGAFPAGCRRIPDAGPGFLTMAGGAGRKGGSGAGEGRCRGRTVPTRARRGEEPGPRAPRGRHGGPGRGADRQGGRHGRPRAPGLQPRGSRLVLGLPPPLSGSRRSPVRAQPVFSRWPRAPGRAEEPRRAWEPRTELALKETMSSGGAEDDIPQAERKTVTDFCYLLDKSKQLFNGLRDLPQYGQKQWQSYFGRTFDVYTKLWKFQQQHRQVLDNRYGLKRWQIGEIASKIGQLYYHYYLRTSETSYLNEAFSFYSAIRQRSYYSQVNKEDRPELVVKKLRYYARFIVVCLLLNKMDVVKDLVKELSDEIEDYTHRFNTEDQVEWNLVLQEVAAFIEADPVMVLNDDNTIVITSNRLSETGAPLLEQGMIVGQLALADALIIGNCNNQVKFSELTIDMFRMLQALEREPMNLASQMNKPGMQESTEKPARRENPHKYLLYKPTFSQLYTFLAASFKELPANSVLLIYLSATGVFPSGRSDSEGPYDFGGVLTNSNRDIINGDALHKRNQAYKEMHCLHPGDLYPFTRKPLFIIVDSSNSVAYKNFTNLFGQPLVCLLSPTAYPKALQDQSQRGSLFTLFLNNPLMAFLFVSGLSSMRRGLWEKCQDYLRKINRDIAQLLTHSRSIDQSFLQFFGDEFLRLLLTRFIFCSATMRMHKIFRETRNYPESYPQLPRDETVENPHLQKHILELASILDVRNVFLENTLDDY